MTHALIYLSDELILFKTNAMAELEWLGKKVEAVNEKVKNINKALESMENYNYQYNMKLGIPRTLGTWISEWHRETIRGIQREYSSKPLKHSIVKRISPSTLGYKSETSLAQAKIYDHLY